MRRLLVKRPGPAPQCAAEQQRPEQGHVRTGSAAHEPHDAARLGQVVQRVERLGWDVLRLVNDEPHVQTARPRPLLPLLPLLPL